MGLVVIANDMVIDWGRSWRLVVDSDTVHHVLCMIKSTQDLGHLKNQNESLFIYIQR